MPEKFGACCDGVTEFVEEEQLMSPAWTCAKCSALFNTVSLSLSWREMDLTDEALRGFKSWDQGLKWRPVMSVVLQGSELGNWDTWAVGSRTPSASLPVTPRCVRQ